MHLNTFTMSLRKIAGTVLALSLCASTYTHAQTDDDTRQKLIAALDSDIRSAEDRSRDANRQPLDVLSFFGLRDDMRVIEILPFSGWYTKILGPVLRDEGQLYVTQPDLGRYSEGLVPTLQLSGMDRVQHVDWNGAPDAEGLWIASGDWDVEPVDMVLTFQNYHNFDRQARMRINDSVFDALKPGGIYGIVDHTRRHMETSSRENGRRVDPVLVIREVQEAGFVLEDYSDLLHRPDDALTLEVGNSAVSGNSDRFTLLFRKPG